MKRILPMILSLVMVFAGSLLGTNTMLAQGKASIIGRVIDANGPLPGVTVRLESTTIGAVSDNQGSFRITNVEAGSYKLLVSIIGYNTLEQSISVSASQVVNLGNIELSEATLELNDVMILGSYLPSQMRALSMMKESNAIQNVLASDAIGKLPDRNAAEAVQRIPGVTIERDQGEGRFAIVRGTPIEWNSARINGDRIPSTDILDGSRSTALDVIPSELIEYVTVTKAITPDMEGDVIGGVIDFQTRTAPVDGMFNVSLAGGYNAQVQDGTYNGSIVVGDRFLDNKLGVIATAAIWTRKWASDNYELEYNFQYPGEQGFSINNMQLRDYEGSRQTIGFNLATDYQIDDNNQLFARGLYNRFQDREFVRQHDFYYPDPLNPVAGIFPLSAAGNAELMARNANFLTTLYGGEIGGEHQLSSTMKVDWKGSYYLSDLTTGADSDLPVEAPGLAIAIFRQEVDYDNVSSDGYQYWGFDAPDGVGPMEAPFAAGTSTPLDASQMELQQLLNFGSDSREEDFVGQVNFELEPASEWKIKFGAKYRSKSKQSFFSIGPYLPLGKFIGMPELVQTLDQLEREPYDTKGGMLKELGSPYEDLFIDNITEDQLEALLAFAVSPEGQQVYLDATNTGEDAISKIDGSEQVTAGYGMAEWQATKDLSFVGGLRYEFTQVELNGFYGEEVDEELVLTEIEATNSYHAVQPMVHAKWEATENLNVRAAYTRTFARPNFSDLNPSALVDPGTIPTISQGNPNLKPTFSNNFDLLGSYYFKDVGILSGGVFYKDLKDVIFSNTTQLEMDGQLVNLVQPENSEDAWLFGVEVGFSKRLTFLPGFLSGFGVNTNYTFTQSEVAVPGFDDKQPLINQPEHIFNAILFYEKHGITARIAGNYKGEYVDEYRLAAGPAHYRWYDKNFTVDFNAAYAINNQIRVFVEVNNLTNEPLRYYHGSRERTEQEEYYSIRGQAGIRISL
ncbi:TonB-dependent receptor [Pontibacter sp. G13]|uniref:TonB-dependent receptor n=1 Tax=Pontibacter sp. G13 TaxID=3074898 RepID=UPI00288AFF32|nr:TonB-dependent receptor [Pontibacter sp. G13]WNJ18463.1 TonB-dependent receptor [Pontibacter sp. G13]